MKIYFKKGFYYKGLLYGWKNKKLYRLPKMVNNRSLSLLELTKLKVGNNYGCIVGLDRKSMKQLEQLTTDINYIYEKIEHEDCPF